MCKVKMSISNPLKKVCSIDPKEQKKKRKKNSVVRVKVRREACTDTKKQKGERKTKLTSIYTEPN